MVLYEILDYPRAVIHVSWPAIVWARVYESGVPRHERSVRRS